MDKWIEIIFEAEDMWRNSREAKIAAIRNYETEEYCRGYRDRKPAVHQPCRSEDLPGCKRQTCR